MTGIVEVNDFLLWCETVELDNGLRMRISLAEWKKLKLQQGQRIPVRLPGKPCVWLRVTEAIELAPNVLLTLSW